MARMKTSVIYKHVVREGCQYDFALHDRIHSSRQRQMWQVPSKFAARGVWDGRWGMVSSLMASRQPLLAGAVLNCIRAVDRASPGEFHVQPRYASGGPARNLRIVLID